jgi:peptidoglycan/LPS O-acetylase OafA/YrhL
MDPPSPIIRPSRLPNLDLLRLVAALLVMAFHFGYRGPAAPGWTPSVFPELASYAQEMWAGVSLFFIISGFVIAWSAGGRDARSFLIARAARLYPAFLVCMTLTAVGIALLAPAGVDEFRMSLARWLANLPLVSKVFGQPFVDGAYWSIVVEVVFYAWVAVFLALGLFRRRQLMILSAWLAIALINELVLQQQGLQYALATRHAGYFTLGILAYRLFEGARPPDWREMLLGFAAIALCLLDDRAYVGWMQAALGYAHGWSPAFAAAKLLAMLAMLALAIRMPPALGPGAAAALGGLTYPLYLLHQNLGYALMHRLQPMFDRWSALLFATAAVIAMAWLVHRTIEPAGKRLIIRIAGWQAHPRTKASPAPTGG